MVDVRGGIKVAFSTIFAPYEKFEPTDLKIDARMFLGFQEEKLVNMNELDKQKDRRILDAVRKIKKRLSERQFRLINKEGLIKVFLVRKGLTGKLIKVIEERTQLDNLGTFLESIEKDPQAIVNKVRIKNKKEFLNYLRMGRKSFETLEKTIREPLSVVETGILFCFELFQIPKENIKKYTSDDGEILYMDDLREFTISFKSNNEIEEMKYLEAIQDDRKYGFEVEWVIFNVDKNRWAKILQKIAITATTSILKYLVPRIGATVGHLIKQKVESKSDKLLIKGCNLDLKLIFHEILRANMAIDSIKFQKFIANVWDNIDKKAILKEFGAKLLKCPEIVKSRSEKKGLR